MYTIMFVDDDLHVLRGYERKINWSSMDIKVIGTASDGREALEGIIKLKPDIVLTDIKMPVMDGIELIKTIDEMGLHTHVIIQSGYNEFDFAKQAIKYNAVAYLLKPTSKDEILEAVGEVILKIKKEQSVKETLLSNKLTLTKSQIVELLMTQSSTDSILELVMSCYKNVTQTDKVISVIVRNTQHYIEDIQRSEENHQHGFNAIISNRWNENNWILLFFIDRKISDSEVYKKVVWEMVKIRDGFNDDHIRIALGSIGNNIDQLALSLSVAIGNIEMKALIKANELILPNNENEVDLRVKLDVNAIEDAIEHQEEERTLDELKKMFARIKTSKYMDKSQYEQIMTTIFKMVLLLLKYPGTKESLPSEYEIWEGLLVKDCIESLESYVEQLVHDIFEVKNSYENQNLSKPIQFVVNYVEKHYMNTILLKDLSKSLFISENYLTTLFKKEMTLTYKKYLTMVRIEKAKELLTNPKLKVHHVAEQVGYSNDDYFSKIFKQVTGISPTEYRTTITYKIN